MAVQDVGLEPSFIARLYAEAPTWEAVLALAVKPFHLHTERRPAGIHLAGDVVAVDLAASILTEISEAMKPGSLFGEEQVRAAAAAKVDSSLKHDLAFRLTGLPHAVRPMSLRQVAFMNAILHLERGLIFGVGPTGTGKTHLAIAAGLHLVAAKRFRKLIVTRPRVLLEGEVMTPALRAETAYDQQLEPIEDVLSDLIGHDEIHRLTEHGLIEIVPLGRLRERTFNDCFIFVDEAQNMTVRKMRMALTRLGRNSLMVVTGDPAQADLPSEEPSGLAHILSLIRGTDIAQVHVFGAQHIVRNALVARIEALYSQDDPEHIRAAA
jgi:phosphate starvation-inducible PhoH-like protein